MVATATRLEQQYQRPLRTTINPQQPTAVIPPARAESEYLGLSDVLLRPQEGSSTNVLQTEMIMLTNLNSLIAQRHEHKVVTYKVFSKFYCFHISILFSANILTVFWFLLDRLYNFNQHARRR